MPSAGVRISIAAAVVVVAVLYVPLAGLRSLGERERSTRARTEASCPDALARPDRGGDPGVAIASVLCLHNAERAAAGLRPLAWNARLAAAADSHARDMVVRAYFAHVSPEGAGPAQRIAAAGYAASLVGENLAWGEGRLATPSVTVRGWMDSPGHRANLLRPDFREVGIALVRGDPTGRRRADVVVYATEFGTPP